MSSSAARDKERKLVNSGNIYKRAGRRAQHPSPSCKPSGISSTWPNQVVQTTKRVLLLPDTGPLRRGRRGGDVL